MKKFEAHVTRGKLAPSQKPVVEKLEAPVVLTPEQLEIVAGGFLGGLLGEKTPPTTTTGALPPLPDLFKGLIKI